MHVVVTGALVADGAVLLAHRRPTKRAYPDVWDLPGGQVEAGESELQALAREMREELGVQIVAESAARVGVVHDGSGEDSVHVGVWQIGDWVGSPTNSAPDEHDDIAWFRISELGGLSLVHGVLAAMVRSLPAFDCTRTHSAVTDCNHSHRGARADCRACAGVASASIPGSSVGSSLMDKAGEEQRLENGVPHDRAAAT
ncbi:NUDIX domain-containing protein [Micromonospora sp. NPDC049047]|uniref:NUDIX domain-containing protein n=1 Tax=Micromonospora sp. NPDC049047 TaxID=3155645 RepID=UPI0033C1A80F